MSDALIQIVNNHTGQITAMQASIANLSQQIQELLDAHNQEVINKEQLSRAAQSELHQKLAEAEAKVAALEGRNATTGV